MVDRRQVAAVCRMASQRLRLTRKTEFGGFVFESESLLGANRRRKAKVRASGGASACNAGTYYSGAGRRRLDAAGGCV